MSSAQAELEIVCDSEDFGVRSSDGTLDLSPQVFELCSFMVSLLQVPSEKLLLYPLRLNNSFLQIAQDVRSALIDADKVSSSFSSSHARIWYPRVSLAWLGVAPSTILYDERAISVDPDIQDMTTVSQHETLRGIAEQRCPVSHTTPVIKKAPQPQTPWHVFLRKCIIRVAWNTPRALNARLILSRIFKNTERSPHLRHAVKNAAGVAILSIPAFLPPMSSGMYYAVSAPRSPFTMIRIRL
ncbi:hypothetical protein C0991_010947 [Blastosporella zonata]|nr:hypothetical protein C0991_010947 [Blastosporella zonata]